MPKPQYILCSESGSEDKITGVVSSFNVIEQIELRELPKLPDARIQIFQGISLYVVAVWAKDAEDDPEQTFQYVLSLFMPPDNEVIDLANGFFKFDKPRFRMTAIMKGLSFRGPGVFRAESRIKKLGDGDEAWLVQRYDVDVVQVKLDPSSTYVVPVPVSQARVRDSLQALRESFKLNLELYLALSALPAFGAGFLARDCKENFFLGIRINIWAKIHSL